MCIFAFDVLKRYDTHCSKATATNNLPLDMLLLGHHNKDKDTHLMVCTAGYVWYDIVELVELQGGMVVTIYPAEFINTDECFVLFKQHGGYFESIDMARSSVIQLVTEYANTVADCDTHVLKELQTFNRNIVEVNTLGLTYKVKSHNKTVTLGFSSLGRGERLFVMALMAETIKKAVLFQNEVFSLTHKNQVRFLKKYRDSSYVNIAVVDNGLIHYLESWRDSE